MRSLLAGLRQLVLPWGAGPGQARMVFGPDVPAELSAYYPGASGIVAARLNYTGTGAYYYEGVLSTNDFVRGWWTGAEIIATHGTFLSPGPAVAEWYGPDGAEIDLRLSGAGALLVDSAGGLQVAAGGLQVAAGVPAVSDPIQTWDPSAPANQEGWHVAALAFVWGGVLAYRMVAAPARGVWLLGNVFPSPTKADGTVIATLPAGWRPIDAVGIPCTCNNSAAGETPRVLVNPDGTVQVYGYSAATSGWINGLYSLDW